MSKKSPATAAFVIVWTLGLLATLAFWGVVVWGIVELVSWVVTK